ncbi:hypothetical protein VTK56DRAFT_9056 [Thermocarpiscus australiensis]
MPYLDNGDQPHQQPAQQHHRVKGQKHIVGGGTGARMHAHVRVPSKGLHKHHASSSTAKLNRRQGSLSPDRGTGLPHAPHHHRRATSELKLSRDSSSANLKKDPPHTNLRRNRSQGEVGRRTKSTTSLRRSASNPTVDKLRNKGSVRVQFNLGDEEQEDDLDDEWVDASTSASPLLSRRGSAVSSGQISNRPPGDENPPLMPHREDTSQHPAAEDTQDGAQSLPRNNTSSHNLYLTSRILSRTPSHGAPPMMSTETVSVRPSSSRQQSQSGSSLGQGPKLCGTPGTTAQSELTSRFVGHNSHDPGSGVPDESFMMAANRGGVSRAAGIGMPRRRQSTGNLSQATAGGADSNLTDEDDIGHGALATASRPRRSGDYVVPRDVNRTQQKLNLQRASSSLEPAHPHPGIGIGPAGVGAGAGPLIGVPTSYDSSNPRIAKLLERTGTEYLTVRRHLNPVARSVARVMQLPDVQNNRPIPRSGTARSRGSDVASARPDCSSSRQHRESSSRDSNMADLINPQGSARRPPTPRGAFSIGAHSASSSLGTDDGASRKGLSGSSLLGGGGAEDARTMALLRMMWDKNPDNLSASQD